MNRGEKGIPDQEWMFALSHDAPFGESVFVLVSAKDHEASVRLLHDYLFVKDLHSIDFAVAFISYLGSQDRTVEPTSKTFPKDPFPIVFNSSKSFFVILGVSCIGC